MELYKRLLRRYDDFYRRYMSLTQDTWDYYTKFFPIVADNVMGYFSHPVLGPVLRRVFRFEGKGHHAEACIVPIGQNLQFNSSDKNMVVPIQKLREVIGEASYRIIMNRCICRDSFKCEHFPIDVASVMLGEACRTMVGNGIARYATVEESLAHLDRAAELGLEGRVHFLGHREDVPRLLRSIDVFCLSSRLEGLGTAVLDAMAAGTPVVATAGGGIPEMVEDGVSGLLSPPADPGSLAAALRRALEEPGLAGRLAEGGLARVGRFTAERMVEGTIAVYEAIQKRSGPTS